MRVEFEDNDRVLEVDAVPGESVGDLLRRSGVGFAFPCGGNGTCGKCTVTVVEDDGRTDVLACSHPAEGVGHIIVPKSALGTIAVEGGMLGDGLPVSDAADGSEYAVAVDIGTTTVAAALVRACDSATVATAGCANPQASYGADVISRIAACKEGRLDELKALVVGCIEGLVSDLLGRTGIGPADITQVALAGNTVMECIAAGEDPTPIGAAPFTPPALFGTDADVLAGLPPAYLLPCVAGYVGGDIVAGALALDLADVSEPVLFVDLGTNGEIVLADADRMVSCATAAGPVFEGAGISCGMPASVGAIDRVAYKDGAFDIHVIGDVPAEGICGSGLISALAALLDAEVVDETGRLLDDDEVPEHLSDRIVETDAGPAFALAENVVITQRDIRNVQLAKGSVCAGIKTLMEATGRRPEDIAVLYVAGGLGTALDMGAAARIGLFPAELEHCARAAGNTSLKGACMAACSEAARARAQRLADGCEYIELTLDPNFADHYIDEMIF